MTAKKKPAFPIRMLWATTPEQRERAADMGCNWVLVYTIGHRQNDFPIYYKAAPRVAALRRKENRKTVEMERRVLRRAVEHAHSLGLKAMAHCYELSIPEEFRTLYPRLYRPEVKEYREASRSVRKNRCPCPSDPRVREIVSLKTAETVAAAPGLDGYAFCFNECLSKMTVRHRCERCRDIPFPRMIKWVSDAVRDGVRSVNSNIRFFHRMWGVNEHDDQYYANFERRLAFLQDSGEEWLKGFVKVFRPENMHYKPSRDLPRYLELQKDEDMGFIAKATWADVSIDHPLNPWIPNLVDHDTIVELSWEQTVANPRAFHVLANQLQRMARYSRRAGATGLAGIPCQWGYKPEHHGWRKGTISDAEYQKLSVLNLDVFQAVMNDPDVDILRVLDRALKRRYGRKLPRALAERLVESQEIKARTYNLRGIRANGENLDRMNYQLMRYAPTFKDWRKRTARTAANVNRVLEENDGNVQRAAELVEEIEAMKGRIPKRVYEDFLASFTCLRETALQGCNRQSVQFLMWAMKDGGIPCNMATIMEIEKRLPSAEWTR